MTSEEKNCSKDGGSREMLTWTLHKSSETWMYAPYTQERRYAWMTIPTSKKASIRNHKGEALVPVQAAAWRVAVL